MQTDGKIDYKTYTVLQMRNALRNIDANQFPVNFDNLNAELRLRLPEPPFVPLSTPVPVAMLKDQSVYSDCARTFLLTKFLPRFIWPLLIFAGAGILTIAPTEFFSSTVFGLYLLGVLAVALPFFLYLATGMRTVAALVKRSGKGSEQHAIFGNDGVRFDSSS